MYESLRHGGGRHEAVGWPRIVRFRREALRKAARSIDANRIEPCSAARPHLIEVAAPTSNMRGQSGNRKSLKSEHTARGNPLQQIRRRYASRALKETADGYAHLWP